MTEFFLKILNMSLSASWLVMAVVILRFALTKAPKWVNVLLWGLVAFRLLCPFTLESALSLIPSAEVVSPELMLDATPTITTGISAVNSVVNPVITETFAPEPAASTNPLQIWIPIASVIWCIGMALMLLYTVISYARLRYRVRMAIRVKGNLYISEYVASPFVLGILKPRIYLPYHMNESDRRHVIAHERSHIRRKDHWWKPLGFLLLTVHWFNPLMWLAYILLCRDIELACDEKVIRELGTDQRADYSEALLHCSVTHRSITACPIAFGEVGVKERVKNVLRYQKPAFWVIILCLVIVLIVSICFLTNPKEDSAPFGNTYHVEEITYASSDISLVYSPETCPLYRITSEKELEILEDLDSDNWLTPGMLEEFTLTEENFDRYFRTSQTWTGTSCIALRENNREAWQVFVSPETRSSGFQYLLLQKNGDLYITQGTWNPASSDAGEENSHITHVFKLAQDKDSEEKAASLFGKTYQVTEVLYSDPSFSSTWLYTDLPYLSISQDCHLLTRDILPIVAPDDDAPWIDLGQVENYELTSDNFDRCIRDNSGSKTARSLRKDNQQTWRRITSDNTLYYLLRLENNDLYLAYGSYDTDDSRIRFLLKLEPTDQTDWTVTMQLRDVSRHSAYLQFRMAGSVPEGELVYGDYYTLERLVGGQWEELPSLLEERAFNTIAYVITPGSTAWTSIDWSNDYGELPDGTYRVKKTVTLSNGPENTENRTYYAEFTLGGTEETAVTFLLENITPTGMTVHIQENTDIYDSIVVYDGFWLEVWQNGQWSYLKPTVEIEPIFQGEKRYIHALYYSSWHLDLDWSSLYGQLPTGTYRLAQEYSFVKDTDANVRTVYAEFEINTIQGIDLLVDRISDNGISVSFLPDETVKEGEYFFAGISLQYKDRTTWTDIHPMSEIPQEWDMVSVSPGTTLLWKEDLHKLTNGQYRVGIRVRHVLPSGGDEYGILYEYFDPSTYAWGVSTAVSNISTTEDTLTVTLEHSGTKNLPEGTLTMSHRFRLEKRENNQWVDMGEPQEAVPDTQHNVLCRERYETEIIRVSSYYGDLPNGTYRLVKDVTRHYSDGTSETRPVYAIFAVDSTVDITLGVASVNVQTPVQITSTLSSKEIRAYAAYKTGVSGYNLYTYETENLIKILNSLTEADFQPSPGVSPNVTVTLYGGDPEIDLYSDGEIVEFDFRYRANKALGETWCVKSEALNDFIASLTSSDGSNPEPLYATPLEDLTSSYTLEQATIDKVVTFVDGDINTNADVWEEFVAMTKLGKTVTVRTMDYYSLPNPDRYAPELYESMKDSYPQKYVRDLRFDGKTYTLRSIEDGEAIEKTYKYLRHFTGEALPTATYDSYEQYILTNNSTATWEELFFSMASSQAGAYIDHSIVYSDYIYLPRQTDIPTPAKAELVQSGDVLVSVSEEKQVHEIYHLIINANRLRQVPEDLTFGTELHFIDESGAVTFVQIANEDDICKVGDICDDYGPADGEDNRKTLFELLGITYASPEKLRNVRESSKNNPEC